jgi:serine/threonine protein kinase
VVGWQNRRGVSPLSQSDLTGFTPPPSFGPFRVLHQIGTGVLGPVFRTYEPAQDRLVAVKAFRLDITPEQARDLADRLQEVADADLDHPSIVRVLGAGVEGSLAYSASEYVAAESLDIALRHYAPAGLDMVLPFITQLAGAVDFARTAGIGHGALHPRDIFVTPDEARATGFGVVQALESVGLRAPVRRPYSAPERVDGGRWDVRADVYSLGAIAFELLTGRRPVGADVGALGSNAGPCAEEMAQVISRALSDDPSERYPGALAFAAALEASSRGERAAETTEHVSAAAGSAPVVIAPAEPGTGVHDLTIEPENEASSVEDEADIDDIQLREQEPPSRDWEEPSALASPPVPDAPELPPPAAPEQPTQRTYAIEPGIHEREQPATDDLSLRPPEREETSQAKPDSSLFDIDRDSEDGIPEVQHSGFQPGVLEPGYQSEPPPPEGWDEHPAVALDERETGRAVLAPAPPAAPRRRSVVLPVAITLLLGLFVGFLAGYLVFVRDGGGSGSAASTAAEGGPPQAAGDAQGARPAGGTPAERDVERTEPGSPKAAPATRAPHPAEVPRPSPDRSRAAAPTAAPRGRMLVRSNPSGAAVFVNGRRRGVTPLALRDLAPGNYTVRVSREGFSDASRRVSVTGTSVREVTVRLARRTAPAPTTFTGSLYVDSRPRGARVLLDGKEVGVTPLQLGEVRAGAHVVRLELRDHHTWTASARVVAGQVARVTGSLERMQ